MNEDMQRVRTQLGAAKQSIAHIMMASPNASLGMALRSLQDALEKLADIVEEDQPGVAEVRGARSSPMP